MSASAIESTRWVHAAVFQQYHKVECELDGQDHIKQMNLVTQSSYDHFKSEMLVGATLGIVRVEFGRTVTPIKFEDGGSDHLNQAVKVAGGVNNFLEAIERGIFTPAIQEKLIKLDEKTIELRVKACIESFIAKAPIEQGRITPLSSDHSAAKVVKNAASEIIPDSNDF